MEDLVRMAVLVSIATRIVKDMRSARGKMKR
jgi:hypothetical protein